MRPVGSLISSPNLLSRHWFHFENFTDHWGCRTQENPTWFRDKCLYWSREPIRRQPESQGCLLSSVLDDFIRLLRMQSCVCILAIDVLALVEINEIVSLLFNFRTGALGSEHERTACAWRNYTARLYHTVPRNRRALQSEHAREHKTCPCA
jgi:hypothetical protein